MFNSHLLTLIIFSLLVSTILGFLRFDSSKEIFRYALKLCLYMIGGVILFSWIMRIL